MWKRLNTKERQYERSVGSPTLIETSVGEKPLQDTTNINSINNGSFSISSRPAFGRKQTEDVLKELPALPFKSLHISGVNQNRPISGAPTASSIYSQPSLEPNIYTPPQSNLPPRSSSLYPEDISPAESIYTIDGEKTEGRRSSPDVSPISASSSPLAGRAPAFAGGKFNSNIPVPKKTRKFWNRPSIGSPEQESTLTHWDVYSGEPTTSEKGKPPSTTPKAVKLHADPAPGRLNGNYGTSTHISGGSSGGKMIGRKRVASRDLSSTPIVRPEWKGAGGRHKIVNPLIDKPLPPGQSPNFPAGKHKYEQEQREQEQREHEQREHEQREHEQREHEQREHEQREHEQREHEQREREQREKERAVETIVQATPTNKVFAHDVTSQPSQPSIMLDNVELSTSSTSSNTHIESSPEALTPPTFHQYTGSRNSSLTLDDIRSPLARNPSNEEIMDRRAQGFPDAPQSSPREEHSPDADVIAERHPRAMPSIVPNDRNEGQDSSLIESRFRADLQHMHLQGEPQSRFSATTIATTNCDSPPATPEMGSYSPSTMSTTPNSILNRKRPVPPAGISNLKAAARKPTPSEISVSTKASETRRKSLPKSPPEIHAVSRVTAIQAKLDNLKRRKNNLQTVIHELTHVVQPSSIAYDMASRQEIRKTVDGLNKELAEVIKDEHETGLKLHRALKRNDEFAAYEPTSIWVRRVTS